MEISVQQTAARLLEKDDIAILAHRNPDGDTLGCAYALYYALTSLGKRTAIYCSDPAPEKYDYFTNCSMPELDPRFIVAVDIASEQLFGSGLKKFAGMVDLCIDHHPSNTHYAKELCLRANAAAAAEILYDLVCELGAAWTQPMVDALYTGVATDTGCFQFANTTARTHQIAADLIIRGAQHAMINQRMFQTKSRLRLVLEQAALENMEFYCDDRCAVIAIPKKLLLENGADESELDGIAGLPRQVEGVLVGVTITEREKGYKVSLRTQEPVDASAICATFGGGGHARAAGCFLTGTLEEVKAALIKTISEAL